MIAPCCHSLAEKLRTYFFYAAIQKVVDIYKSEALIICRFNFVSVYLCTWCAHVCVSE